MKGWRVSAVGCGGRVGSELGPEIADSSHRQCVNGCVPVKLHLHRQGLGWIWRLGPLAGPSPLLRDPRHVAAG